MSDLSELISRLELSGGPSRDLDGEIHIACGLAGEQARSWGPYLRRKMPRPEYTASIGAAIALADQLLPGRGRWGAKGRMSPQEPMFAYVILDTDLVRAGEEAVEISSAEHNIEAIALCLAVLKALPEKHP